MVLLTTQALVGGSFSNALECEGASPANAHRLHRSESNSQPVSLVRVVDGDTILLNIDGVEERVRLIGIDTPESVHPDKSLNSSFGHEASDYVKNLLAQTESTLYLELDVQERDRYGRLLGYLWLDDQMLNETLLIDGYAQISTYPPNTRYVDAFIESSHLAREAGKGFWAADTSAFTGEESSNNDVTASNFSSERTYIANARTGVFHESSCKSVKQIAEHNKVSISSREEAERLGYRGCKNCNP